MPRDHLTVRRGTVRRSLAGSSGDERRWRYAHQGQSSGALERWTTRVRGPPARLEPGVSLPGLGAHLNGFPRASERRRVGQVQVTYAIDGHGVEDRCGCDVDPLGY